MSAKHFKSICQYGVVHNECCCKRPVKVVRKVKCNRASHKTHNTDPLDEIDYLVKKLRNALEEEQ